MQVLQCDNNSFKRMPNYLPILCKGHTTTDATVLCGGGFKFLLCDLSNLQITGNLESCSRFRYMRVKSSS